MTEQKRNTYEDEDFQKCLKDIEDHEQEKVEARAEAAGKCSAINRKIKDVYATAKELGIPKSILSRTVKTRKLERQMQKIANSVPEDEIELFEDAAGQFSFLKPKTPGETPMQIAAREAKEAIQKVTDQELAEGDKVLDDLANPEAA